MKLDCTKRNMKVNIQQPVFRQLNKSSPQFSLFNKLQRLVIPGFPEFCSTLINWGSICIFLQDELLCTKLTSALEGHHFIAYLPNNQVGEIPLALCLSYCQCLYVPWGSELKGGEYTSLCFNKNHVFSLVQQAPENSQSSGFILCREISLY